MSVLQSVWNIAVRWHDFHDRMVKKGYGMLWLIFWAIFVGGPILFYSILPLPALIAWGTCSAVLFLSRMAYKSSSMVRPKKNEKR